MISAAGSVAWDRSQGSLAAAQTAGTTAACYGDLLQWITTEEGVPAHAARGAVGGMRCVACERELVAARSAACRGILYLLVRSHGDSAVLRRAATRFSSVQVLNARLLLYVGGA